MRYAYARFRTEGGHVRSGTILIGEDNEPVTTGDGYVQVYVLPKAPNGSVWLIDPKLDKLEWGDDRSIWTNTQVSRPLRGDRAPVASI